MPHVTQGNRVHLAPSAPIHCRDPERASTPPAREPCLSPRRPDERACGLKPERASRPAAKASRFSPIGLAPSRGWCGRHSQHRDQTSGVCLRCGNCGPSWTVTAPVFAIFCSSSSGRQASYHTGLSHASSPPAVSSFLEPAEQVKQGAEQAPRHRRPEAVHGTSNPR